MAKSLGRTFGAVFATYFIVYPVIYYVYNYFIVGMGYPQYQIPGFWLGMAGFFLFTFIKNIFKGR